MCVNIWEDSYMAVSFALESRPNKAGEFPIRISISIRQVRVQSTSGFSVPRDKWVDAIEDENKKKREQKAHHYVIPTCVTSKGFKGSEINSILTNIKTHFDEYEKSLTELPTSEDLKEQFKIATGQVKFQESKTAAKASSIFDRLEEFTKEQGQLSQWAYATFQCWTTFTHHLEHFSKRVKFEDFDENGLIKYINFLRSKEGLEEKTVQKQYSMLKWFITWAVRKGYTRQDYIIRYKPKFKVLQKPVIFLTKEELLKVYNYEIPANQTVVKLHRHNGEEYEFKVEEAGALAKTRDLFCFCAFTSLRYSDMAKVKRSDIDGNMLYVTTQKTNDRLPIDLNAFARAILDKYKNEKFPGNLALPVISNQKMNKYLKDLCELCEINDPITVVCYRAGTRVEETSPKYELIGTHAGRRTFICFALSSGIPPQVVMKWTGHSDYKAMKPYIDIAEKTKANAMALFEKELKG